ncbi:MAG TPA: hypothetical protein VGN63_19435 [Flavisolibacter sp.]|jgi:hypothetical protein|nr:hypothetical protein [Flavisolibacter sp.]
MITIPQILLALLVLGLFTAAFYVCFRSTKGPLSIFNLKAKLQVLKRKFENQSAVDPEEERSIMERLQNKTKTSCSREVISSNKDLKELFSVTCQFVNGTITSAGPINKSSWLRYGALMNDFNEHYFIGRMKGN